MLGNGKVVPYRYWKNADGRTASVTGAIPHGEGWAVVDGGFTIQWENGTRGCGRPPFATVEEAEAFLVRRQDLAA